MLLVIGEMVLVSALLAGIYGSLTGFLCVMSMLCAPADLRPE